MAQNLFHSWTRAVVIGTLSHTSSLCTTFNSPFGGYRVLRLPGLGCVQDIFQGKVDETFCDLPSVSGIADDSDLNDHSENLRAVLLRHVRLVCALTWINAN